MSYPIIYESTETAFKTNGLGRLQCKTCKVTQERNSTYELEATVALNAEHLDILEQGMILYCKHSEAGDKQPFRIYRISRPLSGEVTINAQHISYDLNKMVVMPCSAESITSALTAIASNIVGGANTFTFETDKTTSAHFEVVEPQNLRATINGQEGSILDVYGGGEIDFDVFNVKISQHIGSDNGVTIRYGKNLSDMTRTIDSSDIYTACVPYYTDQNDKVHLCDGDGVVYSDWYDESTANYLSPLSMNDFFEDTSTTSTDSDDEEVYYPTSDEMRAKALSYMTSNNIGLASDNIDIDFVHLWQTTEYADVAPLERVNLCDTVTIYYPKADINVSAKVIKTVYNVLTERYDSIELGDAKSNMSDVISKGIESAVSSLESEISSKVNKTQMEKAIESATSLLTGAYGGHVVFGYNSDGEPNEIFIMDTDDTSTATQVLRINMNGIGFSDSGIDGPYDTAWTLDGNFVADYITTGTLNANLITAGVLSDGTNSQKWDLAGQIFQSGSDSTGEMFTIQKGIMKFYNAGILSAALYAIGGLNNLKGVALAAPNTTDTSKLGGAGTFAYANGDMYVEGKDSANSLSVTIDASRRLYLNNTQWRRMVEAAKEDDNSTANNPRSANAVAHINDEVQNFTDASSALYFAPGNYSYGEIDGDEYIDIMPGYLDTNKQWIHINCRLPMRLHNNQSITFSSFRANIRHSNGFVGADQYIDGGQDYYTGAVDDGTGEDAFSFVCTRYGISEDTVTIWIAPKDGATWDSHGWNTGTLYEDATLSAEVHSMQFTISET